MKKVKTKIRIPIYGAILYISVVASPHDERKSQYFVDIFGIAPEKNDYNALCSFDGKGSFALFFDSKKVTKEIVAHEIFHLTHRMLEWRYGTFVEALHEVAADLCGYLTALVYQEITNVGND